MHHTTLLKRKYEHLMDRCWLLFAYGRDREKELEELVSHCWVHSGYKNCGYKQMTTKQKKLFDSLTIDREED